MQKLHLIGFTTDLDGLIFSARRGTKSGGFTVAVDDDLIRTIEEVMRLRSDGEGDPGEDGEEEHPTSAWRVTVPQPESVLTPREIQARLRTGASLTEVAEEAGVDEEWVARFAPPVWAEQARIIATAQRLTLDKARVGLSAETLGTSVRVNLTDRGTLIDDEAFDAAWGAYHVSGTTWVITFDPPGRTRRQVAMWQLDTATEAVTAANRTASDLGYTTAKARQRRRNHEGASEAALARVARTATKKSAARQQAAKSASASKAQKRKAAAARRTTRPVAVKVAAKKSAKRAATPAKRPVAAARKAAPKKAAPKKATARKTAAPKKASKRSPATARQPAKKPKAPPLKPEPQLGVRPETISQPPSSRPIRFPEPAPAPDVSRAEVDARYEAAAAAAREERRRAREERRAAAMAAVLEERERESLPRDPAPPPAAEPDEIVPARVLAPTQAQAPAPSPPPPPEERRPTPPVIAAAVASDEASGRVVRIHANRAAPVPAPETGASSRRARSAERRRRRMFRGD